MVTFMNKRGLFFWIELIILVIVLTLIILSFPRSQDNFLSNKDSLDLQKLGFTALQSLDNRGILENYTNATDFSGSNFTALSVYIRSSLPGTVAANLEYFNGTNCRNEAGQIISNCGNFTKYKDTVMADYTYAKLSNPITIQLYLWRILG